MDYRRISSCIVKCVHWTEPLDNVHIFHGLHYREMTGTHICVCKRIFANKLRMYTKLQIQISYNVCANSISGELLFVLGEVTGISSLYFHDKTRWDVGTSQCDWHANEDRLI